MYSRFLLNFCERSLYRLTSPSSVRLRFNTFNSVNNISNESPKEIISTRFPGYKVIYTFPYIQHVGALNAIKRRITYFTGLIIPVIIGFHKTDIITFDTSIELIISGVLFTVWLHFNAIICNNLVGHIYANLEEQKAILSYVNYWGKRIDLTTNLNEIIPLSDKRDSWTDPLYRKITFYSHEPKLKIFVRFGRIMDMKSFEYIMGMKQ